MLPNIAPEPIQPQRAIMCEAGLQLRSARDRMAALPCERLPRCRMTTVARGPDDAYCRVAGLAYMIAGIIARSDAQ